MHILLVMNGHYWCVTASSVLTAKLSEAATMLLLQAAVAVGCCCCQLLLWSLAVAGCRLLRSLAVAGCRLLLQAVAVQWAAAKLLLLPTLVCMLLDLSFLPFSIPKLF